MSHDKVYSAVGLMSGTSLDGVDVAWIRTDGEKSVKRLGFETFLYDQKTREAVQDCFGKKEREAAVDKAEALVTEAHIEAVQRFKERHVRGQGIDLIGFHGQTITHDPEAGFTWQIGDGQRLADACGVDVVCDMRQADMKAGGQGAPFLPLYHNALFGDLKKPVAILNIGGVSNVTWIGEDAILAFDTGPGNALIDDFVFSKTGRAFDANGVLAKAGKPDEHLLEKWLIHAFFLCKPPKSLDRNAWDVSGVQNLSAEDGAATLSQYTIRSVLKAREHFPKDVKALYVTGGGRHNDYLMQGLRQGFGVPVDKVEVLGWDGDALEAEGFAYLAVRSVLGLPLSLPTTTGVPRPMTGGVLRKRAA